MDRKERYDANDKDYRKSRESEANKAPFPPIF